MNKALFWDFDGTLVYSESLWSRGLVRVLQRIAPELSATYERVRPHLHTGFSWQMPEKAYPDRTGPLWWEDLYLTLERASLNLGADAGQAYTAARELRNEVLNSKNYRVYADAHAVLQLAKEKGWKNIIVSNNYPEVEPIMEQIGLAGYFDGYAVSALVGYEKPRVELFRIAQELAGNPQEAFMIGDNPDADVAGGAAAGIRTILVHCPSEIAETSLWKPEFRFDELAELTGLL